MWMLVFSLMFMQQAHGTDVRIQIERFPGFSSEQTCKAAGESLKDTHSYIASETTNDYDAAKTGKPQAEEDKFQLVTPYYTCIEIK